MARGKTKYSHVTPKLPKLPLVESERRDIVNAVKAEINAATPLISDQSPTLPFELEARPSEQVLVTLIASIETLVRKLLNIEKRRTEGRKFASEYAKAYQELRMIKDKIDEWGSNVQLLLDAYTELLVDQMEVEGTDGLRLETGGSISKWEEPYGTVKDKEAFRKWCIANGYEGQLQLWPATMAALVKERLIAGEPEPDGIEVFAKTIVRLYK